MAWFFLLIAGLCEITWAISLKYTEGFLAPVTIDRYCCCDGG